MKDLFFDTDSHKYYYKGRPVPCVSDVLRVIDTIALSGIPGNILRNAADKGTRIHEATEDFEYGLLVIDEEWSAENQDIEPYVRAYIAWAEKFNEFPIASEESLFSETTGVAGTIDLVKEINGKLALIDKKSSSRLSYLRCAIQLNIYRINWNETHERKIDELYILQLKSNGQYRFIQIEINEDLAFKWINIYNEIKGDITL